MPSFDLSYSECWITLGEITLYRQLPGDAPYSPVTPWRGKGRFSDGGHLVLYLSSTAVGAVAEFLRRNPEFLELQDSLRIQLFKIEILVKGDALDVRHEDCQQKVGIPLESLTSSDADEAMRYQECRALGGIVAKRASAISSPSAALRHGSWTVALFGEPSGGGWQPVGHTTEERPLVLADDVRLIDSA